MKGLIAQALIKHWVTPIFFLMGMSNGVWKERGGLRTSVMLGKGCDGIARGRDGIVGLVHPNFFQVFNFKTGHWKIIQIL